MWTRRKTIEIVLYSLVVSVLFNLYSLYVVNQGVGNTTQIFSHLISFKSLLVFSVITAIVFLIYLFGVERVFKYRYYIALGTFILCVSLGLSGSSIGLVAQYFHGIDNDVIFGVSRGIRTDEWAVFTPMTWSQYYGNQPFSYFNSIVRATVTDVFLEYGQPIKSILMVFRPFQIGYLFLPIANGMAFYWFGRLIVLLLVSFEFGRLITDDDRRLSVLYSLLVSFSPVIQWWFATNELVEMLIFLQLSIIVFNLYLKTTSLWLKSICILVIMLCAGGYILSMYPAWMIPLGYVLLVFIVWLFISNRGEYHFSCFELIPLLCAVLFLVICGIDVWTKSGNTISVLSNTAYPGKRFETGGGYFMHQFNAYSDIWYAIKGEATELNTCETAYFLSLFPLGLILHGIYVYKTHKRDILSSLLILVGAFLGVYSFIGVPHIVAKLTFMSYSVAGRAVVIFGFNDLLLLIRNVHLFQKECSEVPSRTKICVSVIVPLLVNWIAYNVNKSYFTMGMIVSQTLIFILVYSVIVFSPKRLSKIGCLFISCVVLMAGLLVNPIRMGVKSIENLEVNKMVCEVVRNDPEGVWVIENLGFPYNNFLIMQGAKTINSTNIYPNIERWNSVDDYSDDSEIYNRYAHIRVNYGSDEAEEFTLTFADAFSVNLTYEEIKSLGVRYIFTDRELSAEQDSFRLISSKNGFYIYEI